MTEVIFDGSLAALLQHSLENGHIGTFVPSALPFFQLKALSIADTGAVGGTVYAEGSGAFNPVYGAVVYDQINRETNGHAIIKKVGWTRAGIRITRSFGSAAQITAGTPNGIGGYDPKSIYDLSGSDRVTVDSTPTELSTVPTLLMTTQEATSGILARAKHDDGLNLWDWLAALTRDRHQQLLNKEILRSPESESARIAASNTDPKAAGHGKGLESLRRILSNFAEATAKATGSEENNYNLYEGQVVRTTAAADVFESNVLMPDGVTPIAGSATRLPFQLAGVNALIDRTEGQGGRSDSRCFLTGRDTHRAMNDEVATALRGQLEVVEAKLDYNGLSPSALLPGRDVSYVLRGYQQTGIVVDRMVPRVGTTSNEGGADVFDYSDGTLGLADLMLIDQRDFEIRVMYPTMFAAADNPAYLGRPASVGTYHTFEQLVTSRVNRSGVVTNIAS